MQEFSLRGSDNEGALEIYRDGNDDWHLTIRTKQTHEITARLASLTGSGNFLDTHEFICNYAADHRAEQLIADHGTVSQAAIIGIDSYGDAEYLLLKRSGGEITIEGIDIKDPELSIYPVKFNQTNMPQKEWGFLCRLIDIFNKELDINRSRCGPKVLTGHVTELLKGVDGNEMKQQQAKHTGILLIRMGFDILPEYKIMWEQKFCNDPEVIAARAEMADINVQISR